MAELVDALVSNTNVFGRAGSTPALGTLQKLFLIRKSFFCVFKINHDGHLAYNFLLRNLRCSTCLQHLNQLVNICFCIKNIDRNPQIFSTIRNKDSVFLQIIHQKFSINILRQF